MIGTKIISQKIVFSSSRFDIVKSHLALPNKKQQLHQDIIKRNTVVIFPLTNDFHLYLIQQYRYLLKKINIEAVSGFIEKNETSIQAAKRELKEEAGLLAGQWEEIARIELGASVIRSVAHLFLVRELEKVIATSDASEKITVMKISLKDAVEKVLAGEINTSTTITGILLLDKLQKRKKHA